MTVRRLLAGIVLGLLTISLASGCGSGAGAETTQQSQAALSDYQTYLEKNGAKLLHWVQTIELNVKKGLFPQAGSRYAAARVPYGHVAPAAQLFEPLNARIDALESEVPPDEFGGFRLIEKTIFWEETTYSLGPVARQLRHDIEELQRRLGSTNLQPPQILSGANKVLEVVLVNEIWGNAEPWSHTDLVDIAAKAEGVDAAFAAVKPLLADENPELVARIEAQLQKVFAKVGKYGILAREPEQARDREPGISFVVYDQVTQRERWDLAEPIKGLASLLSEAEAELANS